MMRIPRPFTTFILCALILSCDDGAKIPESFSFEPQTARLWNESLLQAIRDDLARPTVHARNLFHVSVALYDAWATLDDTAEPYLYGRRQSGPCASHAFTLRSEDQRQSAQAEAMSFAAYRLLIHRFLPSQGAAQSLPRFHALMDSLGYDRNHVSTQNADFHASDLGNAIAACIIDHGRQDGANEVGNYQNQRYSPINEAFDPAVPGNGNPIDPNRWQPMALEQYIDQSGNLIEGGAREFLGAEWGEVQAFALSVSELNLLERDGNIYRVYHDPGPPALLNFDGDAEDNRNYTWGFALVASWSSLLDPADGRILDISPASLGNISAENYELSNNDLPSFYDFSEGTDPSRGYAENPITQEPYRRQEVFFGDYARVLAEFWADGPDSETPPGHWFTILNTVRAHPQLERRIEGEGDELSILEWDVKAYFALGSAMHDAAIAAWSLKGYYDYIRPISALRLMASLGQSSDTSTDDFHPGGLPLVDGLIERIGAGDALVGNASEHLGKYKLKVWLGPDAIGNPQSDTAGVGWIRAESWWPYQRPSFVTPPFAGYVSGHSTYSRAAAEVLSALTGSDYFPGGLGEFVAKKNEFLVFEEGPSTDIVLQWATYRDAADQCSLSRIFGGIHPPVDDLPGRRIGKKVGQDAFALAKTYFKK